MCVHRIFGTNGALRGSLGDIPNRRVDRCTVLRNGDSRRCSSGRNANAAGSWPAEGRSGRNLRPGSHESHYGRRRHVSGDATMKMPKLILAALLAWTLALTTGVGPALAQSTGSDTQSRLQI